MPYFEEEEEKRAIYHKQAFEGEKRKLVNSSTELLSRE